MRYLKALILGCFNVVVLISCCKTDDQDPPIMPANIIGHWEWLKTYIDYPLSDSNPKTPENTGIYEMLIFNPDQTFSQIQNDIDTDSGTFSIGHGSYTPYEGAGTYIYDSILYYQNGIFIPGHQDYYQILMTH